MTRAEENKRIEELCKKTMDKIKRDEARKRKVYVVIFGSRDFKDYKFFERRVNRFLRRVVKEEKIKHKQIVIVEGEASGADKMAVRYALENGYELKPFPADWNNLGRRAGMVRNEEMMVWSSWGIGFWDGESRGTKGMINLCKPKMEDRLEVIEYKTVNKK